jgi:hypothetical protein
MQRPITHTLMTQQIKGKKKKKGLKDPSIDVRSVHQIVGADDY